MSDYVAPGGYYYGQRAGAPLQSVYVPLNQQQRLGLPPPQLSAAGELPPGAVPVINLPTPPPPGMTQHGFQPQQFQNPTQAPQVQYSNPGAVLHLPPPSLASLPPPSQVAPTFVDSDYAAAGWGNVPYHAPAVRVVNQRTQASAPVEEGNEPNLAETEALNVARSEYEQALAQAQRAAQRLNLLASSSSFSIAAPQLSIPANLGQQQQHQQQQQQQQGPSQSEASSAYRFEEALPPSQTRNYKSQADQAESVYIGMPNTSQFAGNPRPTGAYHYAPTSQTSTHHGQDGNRVYLTGGLRNAKSEEDVRTAVGDGGAEHMTYVLEVPNNAQGVVDQVLGAGADQGGYARGGGSSLQAVESDYHFDDLRGQHSALLQRT